MTILDQKIVEWLKTQRHKNSRIGSLGYALHELGVCFFSDKELKHVRQQYQKQERKNEV